MKLNGSHFILSVSLVFMIGLNSCKEKGCTDPHALNYNSVADEDDGSCIICKTTQTQSGSATAYLYDNNFSSPHYNQLVAKLFLRQIRNSYNNSACGSNQCQIYFKIQNMVNQEMDLPYFVQCNSTNLFFSFSQFAIISSLQTTDEDTIPATFSSLCGSLNTAQVNFSTNGTITYH